MRLTAVLNFQSGSLRNIDRDDFEDGLKKRFVDHGHTIEVMGVHSDELQDVLERAAQDEGADGLIVAGGDGTISAAAGLAWQHDKALGVLPGGTMNLFARALRMPLDLDQAVDKLAQASPRSVDIATAGKRPFVHQFSIGLHHEAVKTREELGYETRIGKILAGAQGIAETVASPPILHARLTGPEKWQISGAFQSLSISNNLFTPAMPQFADNPAGGVLGIYAATTGSTAQTLRLVVDALIGRAEDNECVLVKTLKQVNVAMSNGDENLTALIDGEECELTSDISFKVHPGALTVLA